jgi:hypothetical protein
MIMTATSQWSKTLSHLACLRNDEILHSILSEVAGILLDSRARMSIKLPLITVFVKPTSIKRAILYSLHL